MDMMLMLVMGMAMEVDKVADMVVNMEADKGAEKLADMVVVMVVNMEVDQVANEVAHRTDQGNLALPTCDVCLIFFTYFVLVFCKSRCAISCLAESLVFCIFFSSVLQKYTRQKQMCDSLAY